MNLYITVDNIGIESGGGSVTKNEMEALKSLGDEVITIEGKDINPTNFGLPDTPFLQDYLTLEKLSQIDLSKVKLAHFYAGPFTQSIRYLKAKGIKTTLTMAAHDKDESIKEFENLEMTYPFKHVSDEKLWKIYNGAVKEVDMAIVPSNPSKNFLINEGVCEKKIKLIPHGVVIPEKYKISSIPNPFNIGYLGQPGPDKGLKYLIEAWSFLNYQDSTLILAGRGTESLSDFINKYATRGKYHLMGWVDNKADFFNCISVYIQPSVTEAFGIEILEAMSYGRPVISSDGAGASDLIEDGKNGFIVPIRDPKAIANKIEYLRNTPNLTGMGISARETSEKYSWDKIRQNYVELWRSILT